MIQTDQDNIISLKIPIMHRTAPYIYIKASSVCNSYRLSGNYKYLNEQYQLKINFIRDLQKIDTKNWNNKFFKILNNFSINIKDSNDWQTWHLNTNSDNTLTINRIIVGNSTIIILHRNYYNETNFSIFFSSVDYFNINKFFEDQQ